MEHLSMMGRGGIVGFPAPSFKAKGIVDGRIREVALQSYMDAGRYVVLIFFPMAWSFVCPTEIAGFDRHLDEFSKRGCSVLFVSTDSEHVLKTWASVERSEGGIGAVRVPLISDRSMRMSRSYGVLIEEEGFAQRAMFIIDPTGTIRYSAVNDLSIGRSVSEALRLVEALKFSDTFGEGCPADWQAGEAGLKMGERAEGGENGIKSVFVAREAEPQTMHAEAVALRESKSGFGDLGFEDASAQAKLGRKTGWSTWSGTSRPSLIFSQANEEAVANNGGSAVWST